MDSKPNPYKTMALINTCAYLLTFWSRKHLDCETGGQKLMDNPVVPHYQTLLLSGYLGETPVRVMQNNGRHKFSEDKDQMPDALIT